MSIKQQIQSKKFIILGLVVVLIITLVLIILIRHLGMDSIQKSIEDAGPIAPILYILFKTTAYVIAPLTTGPLQMSSGALFGFWGGFLYTHIGEILGGTLAFLIARHLGQPVIRRFLGQESMQTIDNFYQNRLGGWRSLVWSRLFLFGVYDFISYAAGLTNISLKQYVLVSAIVGIIPTALSVGIGALFADNLDLLLLIYIAGGILTAVPGLFHFIRSKRTSIPPATESNDTS